jgi:hypothetical protein
MGRVNSQLLITFIYFPNHESQLNEISENSNFKRNRTNYQL